MPIQAFAFMSLTFQHIESIRAVSFCSPDVVHVDTNSQVVYSVQYMCVIRTAYQCISDRSISRSELSGTSKERCCLGGGICREPWVQIRDGAWE